MGNSYSVCVHAQSYLLSKHHSNSHVLVFEYDALALMLRVVLRGMQCHNQSGRSSCRQATSHWDDTVLSCVLVTFFISALWLHLTNQCVFSVNGGHCHSCCLCSDWTFSLSQTLTNTYSLKGIYSIKLQNKLRLHLYYCGGLWDPNLNDKTQNTNRCK